VNSTAFGSTDNEESMKIEAHPMTGRDHILRRLQELLQAGGDPQGFDLESWLDGWLLAPHVELNGRRPCDVMDTEDGLEHVVRLLERMGGGLPA